ncbi:uncharacterized protein LOC144112596 [Amblyomma americanum]
MSLRHVMKRCSVVHQGYTATAWIVPLVSRYTDSRWTFTGAERGRSSAATSAWRRRRRRSYENSGFARGTSNHLCICRQEGCDTMVCLLEQALLTPQANAAATWTVHNL